MRRDFADMQYVGYIYAAVRADRQSEWIADLRVARIAAVIGMAPAASAGHARDSSLFRDFSHTEIPGVRDIKSADPIIATACGRLICASVAGPPSPE
jgi:hypothetical protein